MSSDSVTTISLFNFKGWKQKIFALRSMRNFDYLVKQETTSEFVKLMGSGSGNGFSVWPDFGRFVLLIVWKTEKDATEFFNRSDLFIHYKSKSISSQTIYLRTTMVHGLWDKKTPFTNNSKHDDDLPVAVLTRATIRWKDMIRFWRDVPSVSHSLTIENGPYFAAGIGELPFRYQATFSIWKNSIDMKAYAYKNDNHKKMITKTREVGWYEEELFARFVPYKTEGDDLIHIKL